MPNERNTLSRKQELEEALINTGMPDWAPDFLRMLSQTCNVRASCMAVNISGPTAYRAYQLYPIFREAWNDAIREGRDMLLQEAWRRALSGSDKMLALLLKMYFPEYFPRPGTFAQLGQRVEDEKNDKLIISGERIDYDGIRARISQRYLPQATANGEGADPPETDE